VIFTTMKNLIRKIKLKWIIVGFVVVNLLNFVALVLVSDDRRLEYGGEVSLVALMLKSVGISYLIMLLISAGMMLFGMINIISSLIKRKVIDRGRGLFLKGLLLLIFVFVTFFVLNIGYSILLPFPEPPIRLSDPSFGEI